jgi:CubicO group peptidase (beta-lactamase class C family)
MNGIRSSNDMHKLREYDYKNRKEYEYRRPIQLGDGLETGSVTETSIDTAALYSIMDDIITNYDYMHSTLIIKDGKLAVEEYFNGWDPVRLHRAQSVTKSYTSTLVGLALQHGYI